MSPLCSPQHGSTVVYRAIILKASRLVTIFSKLLTVWLRVDQSPITGQSLTDMRPVASANCT
jgi:hypothetical protein